MHQEASQEASHKYVDVRGLNLEPVLKDHNLKDDRYQGQLRGVDPQSGEHSPTLESPIHLELFDVALHVGSKANRVHVLSEVKLCLVPIDFAAFKRRDLSHHAPHTLEHGLVCH